MIEAIITDVTRMRSNRVCIAALAGRRQIRLDRPAPTDEWVQKLDGLHPGSVVEVNWKSSGNPAPHVEDGSWEPDTLKKIGDLNESELIDVLEPLSFDSVRAAYGEPMILGKAGSCAFAPEAGARSLSSIRASITSVNAPWDVLTEKVRVGFDDASDQWRQVPLQDLLINQHVRTCKKCSSNAQAFIDRDVPKGDALLRVGLARAESLGPYPSACWLQVNHVLMRRERPRRHFP